MFTLKYCRDYLSKPLNFGDVRRPPDKFDISIIAVKGFFANLLSRLAKAAFLYLFAFCRAFCPNLKIGRLVLVTRADDIVSTLENSDAFAVPYGPEMTELAGGANFVLGTDGQEHIKKRGVIDLVVRSDDKSRITSETARIARALIASSSGRVDAMHDLIMRVATETCLEYFGLTTEDHDAFAEWTLAISNLLFADPWGSPVNRTLAFAAAARLRAVISRAIASAKRSPPPDSLVGRFVKLQQSGMPGTSDADIVSALTGLAVGFIPTTTLGAGNMLIEILNRPEIFELAKRAAQNGQRDRLKSILHEAGRLNPALALGQWRIAVTDATIAEGTMRARKVKKDAVVLVATASGLRDSRKFISPTKFDPNRAFEPDLMFGDGPHWCVGKYIALEQITEIFLQLFSQDRLEPCWGWRNNLSSVGPFAQKLEMTFKPAVPATQSMFIIGVPVSSNVSVAELQQKIGKLGNPAQGEVWKAFAATGVVHFASLSAVDAGDGDKPSLWLLFELNVDGPVDDAVDAIVRHAGEELQEVFAHAEMGNEPIGSFLRRNVIPLHSWPWGATGLNFNGTPEFSVADIAVQNDLATFARKALNSYLTEHIGLGNRPMAALNYIRDVINQGADIRAMASNASIPNSIRNPLADLLQEGKAFREYILVPSGKTLKISTWIPPGILEVGWQFLKSTAGMCAAVTIVAVFGANLFSMMMAIGPKWSPDLIGNVVLSLVGAILATIFLFASVFALFLLVLYLHEKADIPDDRAPGLAEIRNIGRYENHPGYAQNHIIAVTPLKPGAFRKFTLALALWGIGAMVKYLFRPGFVLNMGTIHYARWFRLPGTEKFIFFSNYDGSWESYLEDFITKAHQGQSAAWSNGVGFPKTRFLVFEGAQDGDRFKRWVRRQQNVASFWFSRFPELTTDIIRRNALIREGLAHAKTDTAARAWLGLFGSVERPDYEVEHDEIQTLVFRGLRDMHYAGYILLRLPEKAQERQNWLGRIVGAQLNLPSSLHDKSLRISFGDRALDPEAIRTANFVAFSAAGLSKFGIPASDADTGLSTFPAPFNIGMAGRSRILGDTGASVPEEWYWTDASGDVKPQPPCDAAIIIYARTAQERDKLYEEHKRLLQQNKGSVLHFVPTAPIKDKTIDYEHFGFRDGISQPVIRGTQRFAKGVQPRDIMEPGEFILGYKNNQGYFPPTVTVPTASDTGCNLATSDANSPQQFPAFDAGETDSGVRDFGRNGTFLVIRQLQQHVNEFKQCTAQAAETINREYQQLPDAIGFSASGEWIAAKMMGRWQDGTPLIDRSAPERSARFHRKGDNLNGALPDNDFAFGVDDPLGLLCPLGAHIRRANPRDSLRLDDPMEQTITNRHRILRRGRSYEYSPPNTDGIEQGLIFSCICADLERQFEFIQQTWLGSSSFEELEKEIDPITGRDDFGGDRVFTIPTSSGPLTVRDMKSFVTVRGGGYFFLPSRSALQYLIDLSPPDPSQNSKDGEAASPSADVFVDRKSEN